MKECSFVLQRKIEDSLHTAHPTRLQTQQKVKETSVSSPRVWPLQMYSSFQNFLHHKGRACCFLSIGYKSSVIGFSEAWCFLPKLTHCWNTSLDGVQDALTFSHWQQTTYHGPPQNIQIPSCKHVDYSAKLLSSMQQGFQRK